MVTLEQIQSLHHGQILEHVTLKNADNTPLRARKNGNVKTWKTRPGEFMAPFKHGLKQCFYITQDNAGQWSIPGEAK